MARLGHPDPREVGHTSRLHPHTPDTCITVPPTHTEVPTPGLASHREGLWFLGLSALRTSEPLPLDPKAKGRTKQMGIVQAGLGSKETEQGEQGDTDTPSLHSGVGGPRHRQGTWLVNMLHVGGCPPPYSGHAHRGTTPGRLGTVH